MAELQSLDSSRPGVWFSDKEGYVSSLDEIDQVIHEYEKATMSRFVVYSSNACFSNTRGMHIIISYNYTINSIQEQHNQGWYPLRKMASDRTLLHHLLSIPPDTKVENKSIHTFG
jgi:nucleoside-diphosphate-sugar epimerase